MAKKQVTEDVVEVEEVTDDEVAPSPFSVEDQDEYENGGRTNDEDHRPPSEWRGAIVEMDKADAEIHAVHVRLCEIKPFLDVAIEKSEGNVKSFLQGLKAHL